MEILYIGDIVGRPGRSALARALPLLRKVGRYDLIVANAENSAGGSGLTPQIYKKLGRYGVDVVTLGDHCFRRYEIYPLLEGDEHIVRPANLPTAAAGNGWTVVTSQSGVQVGVVVVLGRLYMKPVDCPFRAVDEAISKLRAQTNVIIVEMHGEATSEKVAMGWYLDGKVSLVVGTHTHVPTADAAVLPGGTGYITDLGMTGPYDSVLGRNKTKVIKSLTTSMPNMYDVAEGDVRIAGLAATIDTTTGKTVAVEQVMLRETDIDAIEQQVRIAREDENEVSQPADSQ